MTDIAALLDRAAVAVSDPSLAYALTAAADQRRGLAETRARLAETAYRLAVEIGEVVPEGWAAMIGGLWYGAGDVQVTRIAPGRACWRVGRVAGEEVYVADAVRAAEVELDRQRGPG